MRDSRVIPLGASASYQVIAEAGQGDFIWGPAEFFVAGEAI